MENVGYCRTMPITIDAMKTNAMKPAASGIGAAVRARASPPCPRSRGAKCSQAAYSAVATNSAKNIVLMLIPAIFGIAALNGTP